MRRSAWRKSSNKVRSDIVPCAARRNEAAEDASADFPYAVSGIDDPWLDALQHLKQMRRLNRSDRFAAEERNQPLVDLLPIPRPGGLCERSLLRQQPLIGHG
jgi:hypothetical protein